MKVHRCHEIIRSETSINHYLVGKNHFFRYILTENGWVFADNLKVGVIPVNKCLYCNEELPFNQVEIT